MPRCMPIAPPIDTPQKANRSKPAASATARVSSASRPRSYGPAGASEAPWPRVSMRITRKYSASRGSTGSQKARSVPSEFDSTRGGASAWPLLRQWMRTPARSTNGMAVSSGVLGVRPAPGRQGIGSAAGVPGGQHLVDHLRARAFLGVGIEQAVEVAKAHELRDPAVAAEHLAQRHALGQRGFAKLR